MIKSVQMSGNVVQADKLSGVLSAPKTIKEYITEYVEVQPENLPHTVEGTFTTGPSAEIKTVDIPYEGDGYPVAALFFVDGGIYNPDTNWYNIPDNGSIGTYAIIKNNATEAPDYTDVRLERNKGAVMYIYKNSFSGTTPSIWVPRGTGNVGLYSNQGATGYNYDYVCFTKNNQLSYLVGEPNSNWGLAKDTTFKYIIFYSE